MLLVTVHVREGAVHEEQLAPQIADGDAFAALLHGSRKQAEEILLHE